MARGLEQLYGGCGNGAALNLWGVGEVIRCRRLIIPQPEAAGRMGLCGLAQLPSERAGDRVLVADRASRGRARLGGSTVSGPLHTGIIRTALPWHPKRKTLG